MKYWVSCSMGLGLSDERPPAPVAVPASEQESTSSAVCLPFELRVCLQQILVNSLHANIFSNCSNWGQPRLLCPVLLQSPLLTTMKSVDNSFVNLSGTPVVHDL